MTLGIAWVRAVGDTRELIVASDSRLSGGQFWDANPKLMMLPRSDCVISFAGSTFDAYPLMLQAHNAIAMFEMAVNRSLDIAHLKGHLIRVFNHSRTFITNPPVGQKEPSPPDAIFMLSGYSWRKKRFEIWQLYFDHKLAKFTFRPAGSWQSHKKLEKKIAFVGSEAAVAGAKSKLVEVLRQTDKLKDGAFFDMEPFQVLRDIIRSKEFPSVGGAPQLMKIYEHMNAVPFGIYWPDKVSRQITVLGRPLLDYEKVSWAVIDPDKPADRPRRVRASVS
jgi:hypothetical protein